jgi:hypothetical protein
MAVQEALIALVFRGSSTSNTTIITFIAGFDPALVLS